MLRTGLAHGLGSFFLLEIQHIVPPHWLQATIDAAYDLRYGK